jgi:hypothetical protein
MRKAIFAFSILCMGVVGAALTAGTASAAQQSLPFAKIQQPANLLTKVEHNYRQYCVKQYFTCRDRWGEGRQFRRCMKWRDCLEAYDEFRERRAERYSRRHEERDDDYEEREDNNYSCRHWQKACGQNWGYGGNDYYGCLRYHGCE